jgi:hypothetical protein
LTATRLVFGRYTYLSPQYIRATMPENTPGALSDEEYVDLIAYMLEVSGAPAGEEELRPHPRSLAGVRIEQRR